MKTLVIGLGNPILGDDGVGWRVAEELRKENDPAGEVQVKCASLGGLALMEMMQGCEHVILVDAIQTGRAPAGSLIVLPLKELPNTSAGHTTSVHDTSLRTAMETGRQMGMELPSSVMVVAIEAETVRDFSEQLSPAVAAAVPEAVGTVLRLIG